MTSRDLTAEQLDRLLDVIRRQISYHVELWRRAEAAGLAFDDPLMVTINRACDALHAVADVLEAVRSGKPELFRPLASPWRTSGQVTKEQVWAERQAAAKRAVEAEKRKGKAQR